MNRRQFVSALSLFASSRVLLAQDDEHPVNDDTATTTCLQA